MISLHARTADSPERSAQILLDRFAGDLATVERYIVDEELAMALRHDDYDSYLHWRRVKSICAGLAVDYRLRQPPAPADEPAGLGPPLVAAA
jgi:hypothetical protein